jgi:dihydrofolate reductase
MAPGEDSRCLVLQMGVSLDGFVAGPPEDGNSTPVLAPSAEQSPTLDTGRGLPPEDPALTQWKVASVQEVGTHIMGRVTYEEMAAHWPSATDVYAAPMNEIPKVVFSKSLERAD